MDYTCSYSPETEAKRILITLRLVAKGFYLKNGFYILPEIRMKQFAKRTIVVPDIDYLAIAGTWDIYNIEFSNLGEYVFDEGLVKTIAEKLTDYTPKIRTYRSIKSFEKSIQKYVEQAFKTASKALPYLKGKKITFNIHPTLFGSCGSFHYHDFINTDRKKITLDLYLRVDQPPYKIVELIASSLTRGILEGNKNYSWRDTEAVSDFFTKYIFSYEVQQTGTLESISGADSKMLCESINYLQSLSAPTGELLQYNHATKQLFIREKQINHLLSPIEYEFLRILVQNPNKCISFDQLTNEMYQTNADIKYSLWGIRKTAQRVREKLEDFGIPPGLIDSVKGEGFMLRM